MRLDPARDDRLDRRHDRAGLHRLRPRLLLARPDPDRRRPVPGLEGDQGDPPHRRSRWTTRTTWSGTRSASRSAARSSRSCCSTWSSRSNSIITAVGMTDHLAIMYIAVIVAITVMLVAATPLAELHREEPDDRDAGARLPADDRHDADRRRLRLPRAQGLHLRRHGLLGAGRGAEHACPPARQRGHAAG